MAVSEYGKDRLTLEYQKLIAGDERTTKANVIQALAKIAGARAKMFSELSGETADIKKKMIDAVSRFQSAQQSGIASKRMQAIVDLRELMVNAPIDFAKAAYPPDEAALREIRIAANPSGDTNTRNDLIAQKAWQTFYTANVEGAGNLWGTYKVMLDTYGPDTHSLGTEGGLEAKRTSVKQQLKKEEGAAGAFQQAYKTLVDYPAAFEEFLKDNPTLDRNAESTLEAFENDAGMRERLPRVKDTAFIAQMQKAAADLDTGREDLYREDALSGITGLDAEAEYLKALYPDGGDPGPTEDTERDLMAAWLKRPDVQEWARKNGLRVGRVVEVTEQQKADIAAGKIPASTVTKYGMLTDGPDDQKAVNFAYKQMGRSPERDLFRRVGFTRSGLANTPIEVEIGADPELYKDPDTGKFFKDPADGKYVKFADVSAMPVDEQGNVIGLEVVDTPPPVTVFRGVARPPLANDAAGSVRFVNEETGEEEYANPDIIRRVNEPGVRRDATKTSLADVVGKATAKGVLKKTGLGEDENDMDIGEKPAQRKAFNMQYPGGGRASVQARKERSEQLEALPTIPDAALDERFNPRKSAAPAVAEFSQRAKASDTANSTGSDVTDRRAQPGDNPTALLKPPAGKTATDSVIRRPSDDAPLGDTRFSAPAAPAATTSKVSADATTPSTTTPTASTDPRREMFKGRKVKKDAEGNPEP